MWTRWTLPAALIVALASGGLAHDDPAPRPAEEEAEAKPAELEVVAGLVGVWDAVFEVWPQGREGDPVRFEGVETNRAFGEHWVASDLESEYMGQVTKVHSIVGYDLDQGRLVGTIVDHGPYAATLVGDYDAASKSVRWTVEGKMPDGSPLVQKVTMRRTGPDERIHVLEVPGADGELVELMQIRFSRRK